LAFSLSENVNVSIDIDFHVNLFANTKLRKGLGKEVFTSLQHLIFGHSSHKIF
jgi:hypothetical protein